MITKRFLQKFVSTLPWDVFSTLKATCTRQHNISIQLYSIMNRLWFAIFLVQYTSLVLYYFHSLLLTILTASRVQITDIYFNKYLNTATVRSTKSIDYEMISLLCYGASYQYILSSTWAGTYFYIHMTSLVVGKELKARCFLMITVSLSILAGSPTTWVYRYTGPYRWVATVSKRMKRQASNRIGQSSYRLQAGINKILSLITDRKPFMQRSD